MDDSVNISPEAAEIVQFAQDWFYERIGALREASDADLEKIVLQGESGETTLTGRDLQIFKSGMASAISIIGKWPLTLTPPQNDELED